MILFFDNILITHLNENFSLGTVAQKDVFLNLEDDGVDV